MSEVTDKQLAWARLWRKFMRLTRGRIGVVRAMLVMADEEEHEQRRMLLKAMSAALSEGQTLSEVLDRHPNEFSLSVRELVKSAERTGAWDEVLEELAIGLKEGVLD